MRLPKVVEKKLGRSRCYGEWVRPGLIRIDPRLRPEIYMAVLIHECMHEFFPYLSEEEVTRSAPQFARVLWRQGFRKLKK